jgi:hypothetical protein
MKSKNFKTCFQTLRQEVREKSGKDKDNVLSDLEKAAAVLEVGIQSYSLLRVFYTSEL